MASTSSPSAHAELDRIASHCIAARTLIEESGTPVMLQLIDLLLFEIGVVLAKQSDDPDPTAPMP